MNFKKLTVDNDKKVLVNFDNVCEIRPRVSGGSYIYFNTALSEDQAYVQVKEGISELEEILIA